MFPNPQAALPFPPKPQVEQFKSLAKDLVRMAKAFEAGDSYAIALWTEQWLEDLARRYAPKADSRQMRRSINRQVQDIQEFATRRFASGSNTLLSEAQFVIASSHGFQTWARFVKHVNALSQKTSTISRFERAADAIVSGDLKTLKRLLREDPTLVRARSTREHCATLLHYVSANGVEGYRQRTPSNAVEITTLLLDAGADVDAQANVYGGGATTLGLVGTSVHPYRAGVQKPLLQVLLDYGAEIDHPTSAGRTNAVVGCLANGQGEAALFLADHGAKLSLEGAGGVGRLDVIQNAFTASGKLKRNVNKKDLVSAFLYACEWGKNNVVEFLLNRGLNPEVHRGDGQTATHCAAIGGQLETIKLLVKLNPPLELKNMYGGSVLGQTLWSAAHGGDPKVYIQIIELLIAAGAKLPERHVPVNKKIDDLLRRYGSVPEPTWYWFGEKPRQKP